ncbi:D-2-hydroxyacid dehydrogenase [Rhizobium sp. NZLR11]|uniref:D-2-hydroxyacid dehydrogenase n=1 Tax=Rhizobium sp. NZLR11 TaxID=2731098 RepID=UPI001C83F2E5|nr:D-2-hydroxyacid dehydrogenase [Rhizobium sp. NZLR11]MBX5210523.1 D-2-hydroxyacid dehydrogenase [Rhizobium sp. NZLR11]
MPDKKKVVALIPNEHVKLEILASASRFADMVYVGTDKEAELALPNANALFLWDVSTRVIRDNPHWVNLEWIHTASIGVDAILSEEVVSSDVVVTHTRGVFERPIAEYVLGLLIAITKEFYPTYRYQQAEEWVPRSTRSIAGQTVVIVGPGAIGREIHQMLSAVGYNLIVVGRNNVERDDTFGRVYSIDKFSEILPTADAVILAMPLTAQTRNFMDGPRFSLLKPGATFINIGRGGLVDEVALMHALEQGRVGTAALDVFVTEPLPKGHPFWKMEQVIVSPHMSSDLHDYPVAAAKLFLSNLERWANGQPLENIVDKRKLASGGVK